MATAKPLTDRQERFCLEYLADLNATAAYKRAGYKARSDNVAAASASDLLRNPKVAARVKELQAARAERTEVDADWVVKRLRRESLRRGEGASHGARVKALELLGKHAGMWKDAGPAGPQVTVQVIVGVDEDKALGRNPATPEATGAAAG